jgi:hypothetical protein
MPNKAAKARKRLKKKLTIENKRYKRGIIEARKLAKREANRDV